MPVEALTGVVNKKSLTVNEYVTKLEESQAKVFDWVAKKKKAQGEMYAQKYNEANKATLGEFKKGDLVKIKNVKRKGKFNKKYNPFFILNYTESLTLTEKVYMILKLSRVTMRSKPEMEKCQRKYTSDRNLH